MYSIPTPKLGMYLEWGYNGCGMSLGVKAHTLTTLHVFQEDISPISYTLMSNFLLSTSKSIIGQFFENKAYWAYKRKDGSWLCELDGAKDTRVGQSGYRDLDWSLDVVGADDQKNIAELWLFCPRTKRNPFGNTARLTITEPNTAFVLKVGGMTSERGKSQLAVMIGQVTDKATGACTCFIWDTKLKVMSTPFSTSVYSFASWRPGIAPLGPLSPTVLGLDLK